MNLKFSKLLAVFLAIVLIAAASMFASMDGRIETSFKNSYVFKTYLKDDGIVAQSKNGVVTLKGDVQEESHKLLAQETAENLPGVKKVDNQLVFKGTPSAENSDVWIATKVKASLLFNRNVNIFKTDIDVKNGVVTLKGEASSAAQKELANEYAADVAGVKAVKNEMTVAKNPGNTKPTLGEKIDDASITTQVKVALLIHRSTSAIKTKVSTKNGVVTLEGKTLNEAEKTLVGKLSNEIKGVKKVDNRMTY